MKSISIMRVLVLVVGLLAVLIFVIFYAYINSQTHIANSARDFIVLEAKKTTYTHATSTTPADPDGPASSWTLSEPINIEEDIVIDSIEVSMNGAPIDTLHHLSVFLAGEPDEICGESTHSATDEIYTVSRNNLERVKFPKPYGIHIPAGSILQLEFMEHTRQEPYGPGGDYHDHTLIVKMHKAEHPEARSIPLSFIRARLDDTPCSEPSVHQAFVVPPGDKPFERTPQKESDGLYVFEKNGVILHRGANLWTAKGGESLSVYINNKEVDYFEPVALDDSWSFAIPTHDEPIPVKAGDVLSIKAIYQNPFSIPVKDASGMFGFYFAEDK